MTREELFQLYYKPLWEKVGESCFLHYSMRDGASHFRPSTNLEGKPLIEVYRSGFKERTEPSDQLWDDSPVSYEELQREYFELLHEYGHYISYRSNVQTWKIQEALQDRAYLDRTEADLVIQEERLAWDHGRTHVPVELLTDYDRLADIRVQGYVVGLGARVGVEPA